MAIKPYRKQEIDDGKIDAPKKGVKGKATKGKPKAKITLAKDDTTKTRTGGVRG